jgi:hypothetical protein
MVTGSEPSFHFICQSVDTMASYWAGRSFLSELRILKKLRGRSREVTLALMLPPLGVLAYRRGHAGDLGTLRTVFWGGRGVYWWAPCRFWFWSAHRFVFKDSSIRVGTFGCQ